ncbi:60S ribosomal protein L14, partial [Lamellibrachia satsuma]
FNRFVEIGRVAYVAFGPDEGKLVVIVDVIDQNRALVDGPRSGVGRKSMNFKQMHLTKFVVNIPPGARTGTLIKAWEKQEMTKKWEETTWAKKIAQRE